MRINGIVWIIVGGFIAGFSYYITLVNESLELQKFMLFIWVGVCFVVYGLGKIAVNSLSKPRKPKLAKENFPQHQPMHQQNVYDNRQHAQGSQFIKFCSHCGSAVRHFDNFCYKCGSRMFHRK